ncbi:MAG: DUF819 family protein [Candidatus Omnitrophica bacterium]|nr:DUF819 family protein [Candidatus Omnitrophota bacterium]
MIHHPLALITVLLLIESIVLYLAHHVRFSKCFNILPAVFWIYFLPMLASSVGLVDSKASVYTTITTYLLPMALFLLLMSVDIKAIVRLGPPALVMFFAGSLGIMLGMVVVFAFFRNVVGGQFWSGFAALSASWTGGSANMIAVKEALGTPDAVFLPMVIVDTIVPYVWMAFMVAFVGLAPIFDRWNRADRAIFDDLHQRIKDAPSSKPQKLTFTTSVGLVMLACIGGSFSIYVSHFLPQVKGIISSYAWGIIIVSCLGVLLSLTPARKFEAHGSNRIGYFILYFVLTSIGARASIAHMGSAFILMAAGFLVVLIHAFVLLITARLMRAPLFLAVVASQANVGGVASAPLVAEIYQKGFASVGLLLAILGNIEGTYIGIVTGQMLHWLVR